MHNFIHSDNKYQTKLRDEYEYDKNGISREYGHFEKLSADERKEIEKQK